MRKQNKEKEISKNGARQVMIKSLSGQMLSEREIYAINNHEVEGLLGIEVIRKRNAFRLIYDFAGLISLNDFLLTPMDRVIFAGLLQNILKVLTNIQKMHFNQNAIVLKVEKVMVNPVKQQLLFMYLPIQGYNSGCSLRDFLMEIIQRGRFVKEEDSKYVQEYIHILKEGLNFSIFELEEYIEKLVSRKGQGIDNHILCRKCGTVVGNDVRFCASCGAKIAGDWKKKEYPYLIREKNSEKIVVDKEEFVIGRSTEGCDYVVMDNLMIGRRHAIIACVKGRYYIHDLHSTNKTYVDEKAIEKQEIVSGSRIRLADEDFIFYENL